MTTDVFENSQGDDPFGSVHLDADGDTEVMSEFDVFGVFPADVGNPNVNTLAYDPLSDVDPFVGASEADAGSATGEELANIDLSDGAVLPDGRLVIEHTPLSVPQEVKRVSAVMRAAGLYFRNGTTVTRVTLIGGVPSLSGVARADFGPLLGKHVQFFRWNKGVQVALNVPVPVAQAVAAYGIDAFDEITAVVPHPVLGPGGELLDGDQGYDRSAKLFVACAPIGDSGPDFVSAPNALEFLEKDWLGKSLFASRQDRLRALMQAATYLRRPQLEGHAGPPGWMHTSPSGGIGKTINKNALSAAVTGRVPAASFWPERGEEQLKKIESAIIAGEPHVIWEDIPDGTAVGSKLIDGLITASSIGGRVLGSNSTFEGSATVVVAMCGISLAARGPTATRILPVRYAHPTGQPAAQDYGGHDLMAWTLANRPRVLKALATVLMADGSSVPVVGRFQKWFELVAAPIMSVAGAPDLLDFWKASSEDIADDGEALEALVEAMLKAQIQHPSRLDDGNGGMAFTPGDLKELCSDEFRDLLRMKPDDFADLRPQHIPGLRNVARIDGRVVLGHRIRLGRRNLGRRTSRKERQAVWLEPIPDLQQEADDAIKAARRAVLDQDSPF